MTADTFRRDLARFVTPSRPVALARFHDGEHHVLEGRPYDARSGWHLYKESWLRQRLLAALRADLDDYWVGISPPCDYPLGTAYYRGQVQTERRTFATIFWHSNYPVARDALRENLDDYALVGCTDRCTHKVPANGVATEWPLDALVDDLLKEDRPILVAAGPSACLIVHEYWKRADPGQRQTILDIGATLDHIIHGHTTRHYQEPASALLRHACDWETCVPWSKRAGEKKLRGNRARQAGRATRYGGKLKRK